MNENIDNKDIREILYTALDPKTSQKWKDNNAKNLNYIDKFLHPCIDEDMDWMDNEEIASLILLCMMVEMKYMNDTLNKFLSSGIFSSMSREKKKKDSTFFLNSALTKFDGLHIISHINILHNSTPQLEEVLDFSENVELYIERLRKIYRYMNIDDTVKIKSSVFIEETNIITYDISSPRTHSYTCVCENTGEKIDKDNLVDILAEIQSR